ncbi:MAG: PAS domain S-box protein [Arcobacteraceae bacterium]
MYKYNLSLLYVENNTSSIEGLKSILEPLATKLFIADSFDDALKYAKYEKPDLVLTTQELPTFDGITLCHEIKKLNPETRCILLSSQNSENILLNAIELGINGYLKKPFDLEHLSKIIKKNIQEIIKDKDKIELFNLLNAYKNAVDLNAIVSKTDPEGIITYVNKAFIKISGYKKEELIGQPHNIIRHPDMDSLVFEDVWNTIKIKKKPWYGELRNKTKDGSSYYVKTIINPIVDSDNNIIEFIAIRSDITEIHERKEYLKDQYHIKSEKFEDVVRLSQNYEDAMDKSSIIIRISKDLKINFVNDNFCNLTGYTKDELITHPYYTLLDENTSILKVHRMFKKAEKFGVWKGELQGFTKQGKQIFFTTTIIPIKDKNSNLIEYMALRNDITKIKELHNELEATQREIIYTMGEIGETRSQETGYHVKRVAEYSKHLALKAGLSIEEAELLKMASPMHDIGKVGIPDSILHKPARLDEDEFRIMKEHAKIGYELLKNSSRELLRTSALVAHEHHERWDGTGYPRGLKGSQIHIFGRITAICDVFDALAHARPYKKAWELERILELFHEEKGKHFDPNLVEIFLNNLEDFLKIKEKYLDAYEIKK